MNILNQGLILLIIACLTSCKTTGFKNSTSHSAQSPIPVQTKLFVTALYSYDALPFDEGAKPHLNFEKLVSTDPKEIEENSKIMDQCFNALNELGYKASINDTACKECLPIKLNIEFEDNGIKESTFLECRDDERKCTLFQKNFRKKIKFTLLDKTQKTRQTIISETIGRQNKVSEVAYEICRVAFEEFPEIRSNKLYTLEKK